MTSKQGQTVSQPQPGLIYLSVPYLGDSDPDRMVLRFGSAVEISAKLSYEGKEVFCPAIYIHAALSAGNHRASLSAHWLEAILRAARELWVVMAPGWNDASKNMLLPQELLIAGAQSKTVRFFSYPDLQEVSSFETYSQEEASETQPVHFSEKPN